MFPNRPTSIIAIPSKCYPNCDFWSENIPSGNPAGYCTTVMGSGGGARQTSFLHNVSIIKTLMTHLTAGSVEDSLVRNSKNSDRIFHRYRQGCHIFLGAAYQNEEKHINIPNGRKI
jgi:hypothetical protein